MKAFLVFLVVVLLGVIGILGIENLSPDLFVKVQEDTVYLYITDSNSNVLGYSTAQRAVFQTKMQIEKATVTWEKGLAIVGGTEKLPGQGKVEYVYWTDTFGEYHEVFMVGNQLFNVYDHPPEFRSDKVRWTNILDKSTEVPNVK
jgi:hypothetical protein